VSEVVLRSSVEWALKRCLSLGALEIVENRTHDVRDVEHQKISTPLIYLLVDNALSELALLSN
jgi:hypothetical protein